MLVAPAKMSGVSSDGGFRPYRCRLQGVFIRFDNDQAIANRTGANRAEIPWRQRFVQRRVLLFCRLAAESNEHFEYFEYLQSTLDEGPLCDMLKQDILASILQVAAASHLVPISRRQGSSMWRRRQVREKRVPLQDTSHPRAKIKNKNTYRGPFWRTRNTEP